MHSSHEKKEILAVSYDAVTGTLKLTLAGLNEPVEGTLKEVSAVVAADFAIGKNMKSAAIVTHLKAFIESLNLQQRAAAELIGLKDKARVSDVLKRKAGVPTNKAVLQLAIAKELLRRASAVDSALYTYSGSTQAALAATGSSSATSSSSTPKSAHDVTRSSFWSAALKASYRVYVQQNPTTPMTSRHVHHSPCHSHDRGDHGGRLQARCYKLLRMIIGGAIIASYSRESYEMARVTSRVGGPRF